MKSIYRLIALSALTLTFMGCAIDNDIESQSDIDSTVPSTIRETGYLSCASDDSCDSGVRCQPEDRESECITEPLSCDDASCECLGALCGDLTCVDLEDSITCRGASSVEYNPCEGKVCGDSCTLCDPDDSECVETRELKACDPEGQCISETSNLVCESGGSCDELERDYQETVRSASACLTNDDCQVLNGQCNMGLGGCYEVVNMSLSQEDLNALGRQYSAECMGAVCGCATPPSGALCEEGVCVLAPEPPTEPYEPCADKACGDLCTLCDPDDAECVESRELKACNLEGECVSDTSNLVCESELTCDEIEDTYREAITEAGVCSIDSDCQILNGQCGVGIGGCYEFVNASLSQDELNSIGRLYSAQCEGPVCDCQEPPNSVSCVAGRCEPVVREPYDPCEGKICGDMCTRCDPLDRGCFETEEVKVCNPEGECVANNPDLICDSGETCDEIARDYDEIIAGANACRVNSDCQVLTGQCGLGLGGCYEAVNMSVSQEELSALGNRFSNQCMGPVCSCMEAPDVITCNQGVCEIRWE